MSAPKTVRIATPTQAEADVKMRYAVGLVQMSMDLGTLGSPFALETIESSRGHLVTNRNVILTKAAASSVDILLWVDGDVAPLYTDPRALFRFLASAVQPDVAMVGAACARRVGGGQNVVTLAEEEAPRDRYVAYPVRYVGLGFCAWNMRWWRRALVEAGHVTIDDAMHFFEWRGGVTEDYRACEFAREAGGKVLVEPCMGSWHDGLVVDAVVRRVLDAELLNVVRNAKRSDS